LLLDAIARSFQEAQGSRPDLVRNAGSSYNSRNLVTRIDSTQEGFTPNTFGYNALGQRIRITDSTGTKWYVWDGLDILLEHDGSGTLLRRYTHGHSAIPGVGSLIAVEDAEGNVYFYHLDPLGGIHRLTDIAQAIAKLYEFGPFGRMLGEVGSAQAGYSALPNAVRLGDVEGLYLSASRACSTGLARWLSRDPLGTQGRYAYAGQNPLRYVDPAGFQEAPVSPGQVERWRAQSRFRDMEERHAASKIEAYERARRQGMPHQEAVDVAAAVPVPAELRRIREALGLGSRSSPAVTRVPTLRPAPAPTREPQPSYYASAQGFFSVLGAGLTVVMCCDMGMNLHVLFFPKIGAGLGGGASISGGPVWGMDGVNCNLSHYKGLFLEAGAGLGPIGAEAAVALDGGGDVARQIGLALARVKPRLKGGLHAFANASLMYYPEETAGDLKIPCGCVPSRPRSVAEDLAREIQTVLEQERCRDLM